MEKNTKVGLLKIQNNWARFFLCFLFLISAPALAYFDQVVIELPKTAKTIYDIRVYSYLRHLYEQNLKIDPTTQEWLSSFFEDERQNYIEQYLAQNYISENDLNIKPSKAEVKQGVDKINHSFSTPEERKKSFELMNISDEDVQNWVTARLIYEKFLSSVIQDRVVISEQRLEAHYKTWKNTRFLNKPYQEVETKVREDLSKMLLQEEFQKWIDQEKRRQKMVIKTRT